MFANAAAYGMSLVAARLLPPAEFGSFGALLSLSIVASTVAIACQTVAARRVAAHPGATAAHEGEVRTLGLASSGVLLAVALVLTPPSSILLHVSGLAAGAVLTSVAVSVTGFTALGVLQGRQSYVRFGVAYSALAGLRAVGTIVGAAVTPTVEAAAVGMLAGTVVGTVAAVACGRRAAPRRRPPGDAVRELGRNVGSMLGLYVFINLDVVLARVYLAPHASGTYAVGSLVSKIAFFLPMSVITVLFPRMAASATHGYRRLAITATAAIGLVFTAVCALGAGIVLDLAGGDAYAPLRPHLWMFALQGSIFAVAQAAMLTRLASRRARAALPVWLTTVALALGVTLFWHGSVVEIVTVSLVAATVLVAALASDRGARETTPSDDGTPVAEHPSSRT
ncbi:lipopolysaccharide biosynthesis protein [Cellulomonas chitinilytica]|nr:hypothetical protein [Cellulomonas chitinilytica]